MKYNKNKFLIFIFYIYVLIFRRRIFSFLYSWKLFQVVLKENITPT